MKKFGLKFLAVALIAVLMLPVFASCDVIGGATLDQSENLSQNGSNSGNQGAEGVKGEKGEPGKDGLDGMTPQLRVNQDTNTWEVSYDNGASWKNLNVKASGEDGITPRFRVNETTEMLEVSYDNAKTWNSLNVVVTGQKGEDGKDGKTPKFQINAQTNMWEVSYDEGKTWEEIGVFSGSLCNHVFEITSTVPVDCINYNTITKTCVLCKTTETDRLEKPLGHDFEITSNTSTCTTLGTVTKTCTRCRAVVTETAKELGHDFEVVSNTATCTQGGTITSVCSRCSASKTESAPALSTEHVLTETVNYPTCKQDGSKVTKCQNCSYIETTVTKYSDIFDYALTTGTTIKARGIDISSYQSNLTLSDFQTIASKYDYIILRAGSTNIGDETSANVFTGEDDWFDTYYDLAKQVGLDVGTYYYVKDPLVNGSYTGSITLDHIKKEADKFVKIIEGKTFEYPVYFDLEDETFDNNTKAELTEFCMTFCDITQKAGFYSGVYIPRGWLSSRVDTDKILNNFDLWIPVYAGGDGTDWNERFGDSSVWTLKINGQTTTLYNTPVGMYQYTASEYVSSRMTTIDANVCYIDYPTIIKNLGLSGN